MRKIKPKVTVTRKYCVIIYHDKMWRKIVIEIGNINMSIPKKKFKSLYLTTTTPIRNLSSTIVLLCTRESCSIFFREAGMIPS